MRGCDVWLQVADYIIYRQMLLQRQMHEALVAKAHLMAEQATSRAADAMAKTRSRSLSTAGTTAVKLKVAGPKRPMDERVARWVACKVRKYEDRLPKSWGVQKTEKRLFKVGKGLRHVTATAAVLCSYSNLMCARVAHVPACCTHWRVRPQLIMNVKCSVAMVPALIIMTGGFLVGWLEGWSNTDSVYWTFITLFSVGYGDLYPQTQEGRMFVFFFIPIGIGVLVQTAGSIATMRFRHHYTSLAKIGRVVQEDVEKRGAVTYSEFQVLVLTRLQAKPEPYVLQLLDKQFNLIDHTKDGILTAAVSGAWWEGARQCGARSHRVG